MRWRRSTVGTVVAALALSVPSLGCSLGDIYPASCGYGVSDPIDAADLVADYAGPDAAHLTLHADGTFAADGIPVKDGVNLSGKGTWSLRPAPSPADIEAGTVVLTFADNSGASTTWTRLKPEADNGTGRDLAYPYGETGDCYIRQLLRQRSGTGSSSRSPGPSPSPS